MINNYNNNYNIDCAFLQERLVIIVVSTYTAGNNIANGAQNKKDMTLSSHPGICPENEILQNFDSIVKAYPYELFRNFVTSLIE